MSRKLSIGYHSVRLYNHYAVEYFIIKSFALKGISWNF